MRNLRSKPLLPAAAAMLVLGGLILPAGLWLHAAQRRQAAQDGLVVRPAPAGQTEPVRHDGDAADDPAIWIHPDDPEQSLILATDKQGGLVVYDLAGKQLQIASQSCEPNNVDVLYGFEMSGGRSVDLAVASTRGVDQEGVKVWLIDPDRRRLRDVTDGDAAARNGEVIRVFKGSDPYGICTYRSARSGKGYFFITGKDGRIEQYELIPAGEKVSARRVRGLKLSGVLEGAVADDERGMSYFAEEGRGIWRAAAEPDAADKPVLIARVSQHGLASDVEGLALYCATGGRGYLIASSQGRNLFKVYRREGDNDFVCTIDPTSGRPPDSIDDVEDTDGIAVSNRPAGERYPRGLFIAQDGHNERGRQNFKIFRWEDIATPAGLLIDTRWDPSQAQPQHPTAR